MALDMDGPFIRIDDHAAPSMRDVWAIGDVTGEPMLAHRAMAQGEMVAEIIAGQRRASDQAASPRSASPIPRSSSPACSPDEAKPAGHRLITGQFPVRRQRPRA